MIWVGALSVLAFVAFILTGIGAYKWRNSEFPLSWWFLVAMSAGSFAGSLFHGLLTEIYYNGQSAAPLVPLSRFVLGMIYLVTIGIGFESIRRARNGR